MTDNNDAPREAETPDVDLSVLHNAPDDKRDEIAKAIVEKMFEVHHARLLRMIEVRLQPELRARVEANDVLQEAFIEAYRQLRTGVSAPKGSSFVWLRLIVGQQLVAVYRRYCQTQKRNVAREFSISEKRVQPDATATSLFLVGNYTSPSVAAQRVELAEKVKACLEQLSEPDSEVLCMRHFEQLSNRETAEELNVSPNTASVMYMRALKKFKVILKKAKIDELI